MHAQLRSGIGVPLHRTHSSKARCSIGVMRLGCAVTCRSGILRAAAATGGGRVWGRTEEGAQQVAVVRHEVGAEVGALEHGLRHEDDEQEGGDDAADKLRHDVRDGLHRRRHAGGAHRGRDRGVQVPACTPHWALHRAAEASWGQGGASRGVPGARA